jgi:non-canonical poly(A) RNA polymerase PAPD5/7
MQPCESEAAARHAVIADIESVISQILPGRTFEIIGSQRTGLATAVSDIDIRLGFSEEVLAETDTAADMAPRVRARNILVNDLRKLCKHFEKSNDYKHVGLRHARYPLISMQHRKSGLDVQIVLSNDSALSRSYIDRYLAEMPSLLPVYTLLKATFDLRGLSDVYLGGLGSYSLFMLLVASLKLSQNVRPDDPAQQLLSFLSFFNKLDTYSQCVSVEPPRVFPKTPAVATRKTAPRRSPHLANGTMAVEEQLEEEVSDQAFFRRFCQTSFADI